MTRNRSIRTVPRDEKEAFIRERMKRAALSTKERSSFDKLSN